MWAMLRFKQAGCPLWNDSCLHCLHCPCCLHCICCVRCICCICCISSQKTYLIKGLGDRYRAVAKSYFAACGGREKRGGEDTSRSVKGLAAPCIPAYSRSCNRSGGQAGLLQSLILPPAAAGRSEEARTPRAPSRGLQPLVSLLIPDLATGLGDRQGCCKVLFCRLRRQGEARRRGHLALRQGACSPLYPCLFPILQQVWGTGRAVAKSYFAACGGREKRGGEDTSRSVKGLAAPCIPAYSRSCNRSGGQAGLLQSLILPPAAAGRSEEARTPRAPSRGLQPLVSLLIPDLATGLGDRQGCCKVLFCRLRRQGEARRRGHLALRQGACSPLYPCLFPILQQVWGTGRAVAKSYFAACGGREKRGGEDTSRSVKGLAAPCIPAYSRSCNRSGGQAGLLQSLILPPAAAGRREEARTPRAPSRGLQPLVSLLIPDLATGLGDRQGCCKVLFCRLRRQGEGRRRGHLALRQGACSPLYPCLFPTLQQVWGTGRAVAKSYFAACGGREKGGGEDTSRSVKGLQAPCIPAYSRPCNRSGGQAGLLQSLILPPAAAGRSEEARTPRAPSRGCKPLVSLLIPDLATGLGDRQGCCKVLFCRLRRQGEARRRGHLALRQGAASPLYPCLFPTLQQVWGTGRAVAKSYFAACGGREKRGGEDTSRSVKGLQAP